MRYKKLITIKAVVLLCLSLSIQADITVTQLANEGVIISDGETRIIIDGMVVEPYSVYGGLSPEAAAQFDQATGAFSGIDLVLVSHRHHDHNQPRYACQFMKESEGTRLASSAQVLGLMREKCRPLITTSPRVSEIDPQYGEPHVFSQGGANVTVFPLSHGTRKYAKIQNYGHLIELGGMTILHIGDAAMDPADFQRAGLDQVDLDVVLVPFWYFQPGPGADVISQYLDAPHKIANHIPPGELAEIRTHMNAAYPRVLILEAPLNEASFSPTGQQLQ